MQVFGDRGHRPRPQEPRAGSSPHRLPSFGTWPPVEVRGAQVLPARACRRRHGHRDRPSAGRRPPRVGSGKQYPCFVAGPPAAQELIRRRIRPRIEASPGLADVLLYGETNTAMALHRLQPDPLDAALWPSVWTRPGVIARRRADGQVSFVIFPCGRTSWPSISGIQFSMDDPSSTLNLAEPRTQHVLISWCRARAGGGIEGLIPEGDAEA